MADSKIIRKQYLKDRAKAVGPERTLCAVLVRKGKRELRWRFSAKRGPDYHKGALLIVPARGAPSLVHEGGRLSRDLIQEYYKEIDAFFGEETAFFVNIKHTLLLGSSAR